MTSNDLHGASKLHNMLEVIEVASELKTKCNVQCEVREIQVVKR
ncbi:hypothetical protein NRS6167_10295 [Bacillus subtilis]|nr:hypothetical protein NRS6167_00455 [Bacillus subtilis]CAI6268301.1 hypothetical protein NRS6167_10295 [Bacillus subtilis]